MMAALIDPDKNDRRSLVRIVQNSQMADIDFFFIGGSLLIKDELDQTIALIKEHSEIPCVLFPGSVMQISSKADAILFLSLISGRNPEFLIGNHVIAAPYIRQTSLEVIPTGYMLIHCGNTTTAHYISATLPIPSDKDDIAAVTAMAGEMLGFKLIYLDAGSGASHPIRPSMIEAVRQSVEIPIIVGGGIRSALQAKQTYDAGADILVIGNALEKNASLIQQLAEVAKNPGVIKG
ncbi:putative glycerol-1-phosphate prenyltransferase [Schleiferia thermophila]|jgi:putative glycerol-1-phosphate prenyltransferase|uniref:Geranylgeranylglyceryl phosphate synthase n=2 Tax=Schleiferia thermophila TaxID=884107 RepID=A0A369A2P0_9FLAO|nr:putative glycerol-1-phosphate prenyltransferase [Schleiferia thermophila]